MARTTASIALAAFTAITAGAAQSTLRWEAPFLPQGADGEVTHLAVHGGDLVAAGRFHQVEDVAAEGIAAWNGVSWSALGKGLRSADYSVQVSGLLVRGDTIYVAGDFIVAGEATCRGLAMWTDGVWKAWDEYAPAGVAALHAFGDRTVAGGEGVFVRGAIGWERLGDGLSGDVEEFAHVDSSLYARGYFNLGGNPRYHRLARWTGAAWSPADSGLPGTVTGICAFDGALFAVQESPFADTVAVHRWDGVSWTATFSQRKSIPGAECKLAAPGSRLLLFRYAQPEYRVLAWTGSGWEAAEELGRMDMLPAAVASLGSTLYVGGAFDGIGGQRADNLAAHRSGAWAAISRPNRPGPSSVSYALLSHQDQLFMGGLFRFAGNQVANGVASWNGSSFDNLGWGTGAPPSPLYLGGFITSLTGHGGSLYAGGAFDSTHFGIARGVFRWDGVRRELLGRDFPGLPMSLVAVDSGVFAGLDGESLDTPSLADQAVLRWDGEAWRAIGSGRTGRNQCLGHFRNMLFAGNRGSLSQVEATGLFSWDGISWSRFPDTASGILAENVTAMAEFRGEMYFAGRFRGGGGGRAMLARWNGSRFELMAAPAMVQMISQLAADTRNLYLAVSNDSDQQYGTVMRWDGQAWTDLSFHGYVTAMAVHGNGLYVSGFPPLLFEGSQPGFHLLRWVPEEGLGTGRAGKGNVSRRNAWLGFSPSGAAWTGSETGEHEIFDFRGRRPGGKAPGAGIRVIRRPSRAR